MADPASDQLSALKGRLKPRCTRDMSFRATALQVCNSSAAAQVAKSSAQIAFKTSLNSVLETISETARGRTCRVDDFFTASRTEDVR